MSFILDALRKSESERQREAPPSPTRIPAAVPRAGLPAWVWLVIGTLSVAVVAIGIAWWLASQTPPAPAAAAGEQPEDAAAAADAAAAGTVVPGGNVPPLGAPATRGSPASQLGRTDVGPSPPGAAVGFTSPQTLPGVAEILAAGIALPPLDLQLISYSEAAVDRFVFINGTQYREGQRVRNGPQIVSILPQGVVLTQQGRDFLLSPN